MQKKKKYSATLLHAVALRQVQLFVWLDQPWIVGLQVRLPPLVHFVGHARHFVEHYSMPLSKLKQKKGKVNEMRTNFYYIRNAHLEYDSMLVVRLVGLLLLLVWLAAIAGFHFPKLVWLQCFAALILVIKLVCLPVLPIKYSHSK